MAGVARPSNRYGRGGRHNPSEAPFGPASTSDNAALRARAAKRDAQHKAAFEAGRQGHSYVRPLLEDDDELHTSYQSGREEMADSSPPRRSGATAAGAAGRRGGVLSAPSLNDGAGFLLGLFGYALVLQYVRGGIPMVRGWLAAKFLNKPYTADGSGTPAAPPNTAPSGFDAHTGAGGGGGGGGGGRF